MELQRNTHHVYRLMYMVVRGVPKMSPSDVMQIVKSISAREFFRHYPEIKKRYFLGRKLWTKSYFVETIGNVNEDMIRAYVRDQLTEHEKKEEKSRKLGLFLNSARLRPSFYNR